MLVRQTVSVSCFNCLHLGKVCFAEIGLSKNNAVQPRATDSIEVKLKCCEWPKFGRDPPNNRPQSTCRWRSTLCQHLLCGISPYEPISHSLPPLANTTPSCFVFVISRILYSKWRS